ncbi:MAG: hypothetical protein KJ955_01595 [Nanoarchaeota archaeon]|nr:hypothetical protein [Nanoarchaeota archaeon]
MIVSINGPEWFYTAGSVMQIVFALVTLLIAGFSYKAYILAKDRKYKYFSVGFLSLAAGYATISLSNLLVFLGVYDGVISRLNELNVANFLYMGHIFFILTGFMLLLAVALKLQQRRLIALLFALMLMLVAFAYQYYIKFHMISLLLLGFMAWQFYENYKEKRTLNAGLVFSSFYLLGFAELFLIGMVYVTPMLYAVGHFLQLMGFGLLLLMFTRVQKGDNGGKHGRKKK